MTRTLSPTWQPPHMHAIHPHRPRPTNHEPLRPPGEGAAGATATATGRPAGTDGFEGRRDPVDEEADATTMTDRTTPTADDANGDATGGGPAGVTVP